MSSSDNFDEEKITYNDFHHRLPPVWVDLLDAINTDISNIESQSYEL